MVISNPTTSLARDARTVGIIDPGQAFAGPAEYDRAHLACCLSGWQFAHVLRGYGGQVDRDKILLYQTVIAMHKAARADCAAQGERTRHFSAMARMALSHLCSPIRSVSGSLRQPGRFRRHVRIAATYTEPGRRYCPDSR